jgi:hypothetical protein
MEILIEASTQAEKGYKELESQSNKPAGLSLKLTLLKLFSKSQIIFRNISHLYKEALQVEFVRKALLQMLPKSLIDKLDKRMMETIKWKELVRFLLQSESAINSYLEATPQV